MASSYTIKIFNVSALAQEQRLAMEKLYLSHYEATSSSVFQADLVAKDEALLLYADEQLIGFTIMAYYRFRWQGTLVRIVFSGDTVVDRAHWGQQHLSLGWIAHMGRRYQECPEEPLYWFLLVKGHRTYRFLPVFAHCFFPHWAYERGELADLAAGLATERFGDYYKPFRGVVAFPESRGQLMSDIAEPKPSEAKKEAVRFFLQRNPGYREGHELVCVCDLCPENLRSYAGLIFSRGSYECV